MINLFIFQKFKQKEKIMEEQNTQFGNGQINSQYQKLKKPLKKYCILQFIASIFSLVTLLMFAFLPNFNLDYLRTIEYQETTLPKLTETSVMDELLSSLIEGKSDVFIQFSVFDEIKAALNPVETKAASYVTYISIFQIIGLIFFTLSAVLFVVLIIKGISRIVSIDGYTLEVFDTIKRANNNNYKDKFLGFSWLLTGIIYEIIAIFMNNYLSKLTEQNVLTSYFTLLHGLTFWGYITALFFIVSCALLLATNMTKKNINLSVLKDTYA